MAAVAARLRLLREKSLQHKHGARVAAARRRARSISEAAADGKQAGN
jgi:hypothetical protein